MKHTSHGPTKLRTYDNNIAKCPTENSRCDVGELASVQQKLILELTLYYKLT